MRTIVEKHDNKKPIFLCDRFNSRNDNKNDEYKIPHDKPQCPIFKDNRCCGGCNLASECDHSVECHCFGYAYAALGGNSKGYYMHKASIYYKHGRIGKAGEFDWYYYRLNKFKEEMYIGGYVKITIDGKKYYAEIKSKISRKSNKVTLYVPDLNRHVRLSFVDMKDFYTVYSKDQAERYKELGI